MSYTFPIVGILINPSEIFAKRFYGVSKSIENIIIIMRMHWLFNQWDVNTQVSFVFRFEVSEWSFVTAVGLGGNLPLDCRSSRWRAVVLEPIQVSANKVVY